MAKAGRPNRKSSRFSEERCCGVLSSGRNVDRRQHQKRDKQRVHQHARVVRGSSHDAISFSSTRIVLERYNGGRAASVIPVTVLRISPPALVSYWLGKEIPAIRAPTWPRPAKGEADEPHRCARRLPHGADGACDDRAVGA